MEALEDGSSTGKFGYDGFDKGVGISSKKHFFYLSLVNTMLALTKESVPF